MFKTYKGLNKFTNNRALLLLTASMICQHWPSSFINEEFVHLENCRKRGFFSVVNKHKRKVEKYYFGKYFKEIENV